MKQKDNKTLRRHREYASAKKFLVSGVLTLLAAGPPGVAVADDDAIAEIVVTSERRPQLRLLQPHNVAVVDAETIRLVNYRHVSELMHRIPGAWLVRGNGQEHQTAIRSAALGGAGACGGFLVLEDGIPIRPPGFCNINQLFEVYAEQAQAVEVIRGPANALHGWDALHGVVNVLMPEPGVSTLDSFGVELGSDDFLRLRASLPNGAERDRLASVIYAHDNGFREQTGYDQVKMHAKRNWSSSDQELTLAATATWLHQDNAGFIIGEKAYRDRELSATNPSPGAFRDATSARIYATWRRHLSGATIDVRPYLRRSRMEFTHFGLPGEPLEENGQTSAGLMTSLRFAGDRMDTIVGLDIDWSDAFLLENQAQPASGPPRQVETRPVGRHYDYTVESIGAAVFLQVDYAATDRLTVSGGLRADLLHNRYRNHMLAGNTRDDGTPCGFGGCLYTRPASRTDRFDQLTPNLSAVLRVTPTTAVYASAARGVRVPQTLELYRLQNGQQLADLEPERTDSIELGLRRESRSVDADVAAYWMRKRDTVFRDSAGFNVTGGSSDHRGIEAEFHWLGDESWRFDANLSYARHRYDFDAQGPGQAYVSGNDIDSAPRWLGQAGLSYAFSESFDLGVEWQYVGSYFLDPENRFRYAGHAIASARAGYRINRRIALAIRMNNAFDRRYADRADYAGGDYRYLPGRGRALFLDLRVRTN